jgi:hypothetical protein
MTITRISCKHPFCQSSDAARRNSQDNALMAVEIISPFRPTYDAALELDAEPGDGIASLTFIGTFLGELGPACLGFELQFECVGASRTGSRRTGDPPALIANPQLGQTLLR